MDNLYFLHIIPDLSQRVQVVILTDLIGLDFREKATVETRLETYGSSSALVFCSLSGQYWMCHFDRILYKVCPQPVCSGRQRSANMLVDTWIEAKFRSERENSFLQQNATWDSQLNGLLGCFIVFYVELCMWYGHICSTLRIPTMHFVSSHTVWKLFKPEASPLNVHLFQSLQPDVQLSDSARGEN